MSKNWKAILVLATYASGTTIASAAEFQKLGKAISTVLGSTKVSKRSVASRDPASGANKSVDVFTLKNASGGADRYAFVQKEIYAPNCTHTWVIGIDAKKNTVTDIQVVEMSCPHAFPTKEASFLSQYKGKGPADAKKLSSTVMSVAKATGSAELTTKAVERSIVAAVDLRGK